jgi:hypothetical protein
MTHATTQEKAQKEPDWEEMLKIVGYLPPSSTHASHSSSLMGFLTTRALSF